MIKAATTVKTKSLRLRLLWGFVVCAALIWVGLVGWGLYTVMKYGHLEVQSDMNQYARQVMSVVGEFREYPDQLQVAVSTVAEIEREPDDDGDVTDFEIQVWLGDEILQDTTHLPVEKPAQTGYSNFEFAEKSWHAYVTHDPQRQVMVRLVAEDGISAALSSNQVVFLFLPLVFSLPLLLLPAWFMTHRGLRPLREVVAQIDNRVDSGQLQALTETPYRELNSIVSSTNSLMHRLDRQLARERSFVADVAHELKTPLAIMQSNIGMLSSSTSEGRREQALADLNSGVTRSNHLIQQLLRMSRMEQRSETVGLALRSFDVAEFVRERVAHAAILADEKRIKLELRAPQNHCVVTDADAIAAIVDNLLDNAIKYSPENSTVALSLDLLNDQKAFQIRVQDEGPGITPAQKAQALARFGRLDSTTGDTGGAGLGLSIVSQAVARLGGQLSMDKGPDGGGLRVTVAIIDSAL